MPSLWKNQKPNRFSRLVADLQTPTKRGESLVVETGFPTSIVDLFVKNKERLKKLRSSKRQKSKQTTPKSPTTSENELLFSDDEAFSITPSSSVSDRTFCFPIIDDPAPLIDDDDNKKQETNESLVDPCVEESVSLIKTDYDGLNSSNFACFDDDCANDKEDKGDDGAVSESKSGVRLLVSKGVLVLAVAIYTKRFVVGIAMGALVLLLLEYVGKWVFQGFKHVVKKSQCFCSAFRSGKKARERILKRAINIGSRSDKEGANGVGCMETFEEEVENNVVVEHSESRNDVALRNFVEQKDGCDVDVGSNGGIKEGSGGAPSSDEMMENTKPVCEIETAEADFCEWPRPEGVSRGGGGENEDEGLEMADHKGKNKKKKKFWKKLVSKRKRKNNKNKKHKDEEASEVVVECNWAEFEEDDELSRQEADYGERLSISSLSSSSDDEEFEGLRSPKHCNTKMLQIDNKTLNTSGTLKARGCNIQWMAISGIALFGLIKGRIFALTLTVFCCLLSRMVRPTSVFGNAM